MSKRKKPYKFPYAPHERASRSVTTSWFVMVNVATDTERALNITRELYSPLFYMVEDIQRTWFDRIRLDAGRLNLNWINSRAHHKREKLFKFSQW